MGPPGLAIHPEQSMFVFNLWEIHTVVLSEYFSITGLTLALNTSLLKKWVFKLVHLKKKNLKMLTN